MQLHVLDSRQKVMLSFGELQELQVYNFLLEVVDGAIDSLNDDNCSSTETILNKSVNTTAGKLHYEDRVEITNFFLLGYR